MRCEALGLVVMIEQLGPTSRKPGFAQSSAVCSRFAYNLRVNLQLIIATMTAFMLTGLITLLSAGAVAQSFESGRRKLPLSSLSQPAYEPTKQPTSGGRCSDDSSWRYDGGDKGGELGL